MDKNDIEEEVKEVYARFGLALYCAQVLEHGIVNALIVVDLIPSRRHRVRSIEEWESLLDSYADSHFALTMGKLVRDLRSVTPVSPDLEDLLGQALAKRNWLAHGFFRERATEFMDSSGREQMLTEIDECRAVFEAADQLIEVVLGPLRAAAGITDEIVERALEDLIMAAGQGT